MNTFDLNKYNWNWKRVNLKKIPERAMIASQGRWIPQITMIAFIPKIVPLLAVDSFRRLLYYDFIILRLKQVKLSNNWHPFKKNYTNTVKYDKKSCLLSSLRNVLWNLSVIQFFCKLFENDVMMLPSRFYNW